MGAEPVDIIFSDHKVAVLRIKTRRCHRAAHAVALATHVDIRFAAETEECRHIRVEAVFKIKIERNDDILYLVALLKAADRYLTDVRITVDIRAFIDTEILACSRQSELRRRKTDTEEDPYFESALRREDIT